jgi:RNA polymerase sigma factor (TIGR02999 family)
LPSPAEVAGTLQAFASGDKSALDRLIPLVYDDLRDLARRRRSIWRNEDTPGETSLVHQLYVKLAENGSSGWQDRRHFLCFASAALRNLLNDHARHRNRNKRSGKEQELPDDLAAPQERPDDVLALDEALTRLEVLDQRLARIVECRFYGGLTVEETGEALGISSPTVKRGWHTAQAWLYKELRPGPVSRSEGAT